MSQLYKEIAEQPERLLALHQAWLGQSAPPVRLASAMAQAPMVIGLAEGSSRNALAMAAPYLEAWLGVPVRVMTPDDLHARLEAGDSHWWQQAFYLVVSQSGRTSSIQSVLKRLGPVTGACITNNPDAALGNWFGPGAGFGVQAGEEHSIAATKTVSCTWLSLLHWGLWMAPAVARPGQSPDSLPKADGFKAVVESMAAVIEANPWQQAGAEQWLAPLVKDGLLVLLGNGSDRAVLDEIGLKLVEVARQPVWVDTAESFKHGPRALLLTEGLTPVRLYVLPDSPETVLADAAVHRERLPQLATTERWVSIKPHNDDDDEAPPDILALLPSSVSVQGPWARQAALLLAGQLLAWQLGELRGLSPDAPNLAKTIG